MMPESQTLSVAAVRGRRRVLDFVELGKPRVVLMILVTTWVGFYLGSAGGEGYARLLAALLGTGLAAAGTLALNQYAERDLDAKMARTRRRPLPDGRLQPREALLFGAAITLAGLVYLCVAVNLLTGAIVGLTAGCYLLVYTPLKRISPWCSIAGAVPGALPPVAGWTAARNGLGLEAGILFAVLFLWQLPHSLAIARLYRDDYANAGFKLLPIIEPEATRTARHVVLACVALFVVGLLPALLGFAGALYLAAALLLGFGFLGYGLAFAAARSAPAARRLLLASLVYLPALLMALAFDRLPLR